MAQAERESCDPWQEVHHSSSSAATQLEQISHFLCWTMERAHHQEHHAQGVDREQLGVDKMSHSGARHPGFVGDGQWPTGETWRALVAAYPTRASPSQTREGGTANHYQSRDPSLFS